MPVNIHGKQYQTVAERLELAKDHLKEIHTEILYTTPVVIKATITTDKGVFSGISAANPNKPKEKESPYEIAETSAVGRALAFAGYGGEDIATAEEMRKVGTYPTKPAPAAKVVNVTAKLSESQMKMIFALLKQKNHTKEELESKYGEIEKLDRQKASEIIDKLINLPEPEHE